VILTYQRDICIPGTKMKEKKARVVDALHDAGATIEAGIVPGSVLALPKVIPELDKVKIEGLI
jgi:chaperonin GroEL (HSP60 family)